MSLEREIYEAMQRGQTSFVFPVPANTLLGAGQSDLLYVDTPAYCARAWTVQLLGYRYSSGPLVAPAATVADSDNKTGGENAIQVRVQWGVDGASEEAIVDYPIHGGSFTLQGGSVRVGIAPLKASSGATPPTVGGFLVPAARSGLGPVALPQLTSFPIGIVGSGTTTVPIPRRAVAYRLWQQDAIVTPDFLVTQIDHLSNIMEFDGTISPAALFSQSNGAGYFAINNGAQYIRISNANLGGRVVGITFLLDLG